MLGLRRSPQSPRAIRVCPTPESSLKPKPKVRPPTSAPCVPRSAKRKPVPCPSCGMALEPDIRSPRTRTEYTCPMHPQIVRSGPGSCPICGMALEPRTVTAAPEENPELRDMTRRFWIGVVLTAPLLAIAMGSMLWPRFHGGDRHPRDLLTVLSLTRSSVDRIPARHSGRSLVRPPILPALLDVARQPQPEHVHPDRPRHRRRLRVQRCRDGRAADFSRVRSAAWADIPTSTSRPPPPSPRSSCSDR